MPAQSLLRNVGFDVGDAMALPYAVGSFDVAVMPLVIFFVPQPARGVAEMVRVVRPGGSISAYAWDMEGGGFPYAALHDELEKLGIAVPKAPSPEASRIEVMRELWQGAGLEAIETRSITVRRTFADFQDFWEAVCGGPSVGAQLMALTPAQQHSLHLQMRQRLPADALGRMAWDARANAIKGKRPLRA